MMIWEYPHDLGKLQMFLSFWIPPFFWDWWPSPLDISCGTLWHLKVLGRPGSQQEMADLGGCQGNLGNQAWLAGKIPPNCDVVPMGSHVCLGEFQSFDGFNICFQHLFASGITKWWNLEGKLVVPCRKRLLPHGAQLITEQGIQRRSLSDGGRKVDWQKWIRAQQLWIEFGSYRIHNY